MQYNIVYIGCCVTGLKANNSAFGVLIYGLQIYMF